MKSLLLFLLIAIATHTYAQMDSSFIVTYNNKDMIIPVKIFKNTGHMQHYLSGYPLYGLYAEQFQKVYVLLTTLLDQNMEQQKYIAECDGKDALYKQRDIAQAKMDSISLARVDNFQSAYDSMLAINRKYDDQLKELGKIANDLNKKKGNGTWIGILGGLALGILVGVAVK